MTLERSHLSKAVLRKVSGAPSGGSCAVFEDVPDGNVTTLTNVPLYTSPLLSSTDVLSNPFNFVQGQVDFYTAFPMRVNLVITPTPVPPATAGDPQTFFAVDLVPSSIDTAVSDQGLLSARPAQPVFAGFRYFATDTGLEYYSTGTAWVTVGGPSGYDNTFLLMGA